MSQDIDLLRKKKPCLFWDELPPVDDERFKDVQSPQVAHRRINYDELRRFCMIQPSDGEIAAFLRLTVDEFERRRARDPVIQAMIDNGMANGKVRLRQAQFVKAIDGMDSTMLTHLGKHVLGQTDKKIIEDNRGGITKEQAKQVLREALADIDNNMIDATPAIEHTTTIEPMNDVMIEQPNTLTQVTDK